MKIDIDDKAIKCIADELEDRITKKFFNSISDSARYNIIEQKAKEYAEDQFNKEWLNMDCRKITEKLLKDHINPIIAEELPKAIDRCMDSDLYTAKILNKINEGIYSAIYNLEEK